MLTISITFLGTSCDKEPTDEIPELPPIYTFIMDFTDFDEAPAGTKSSIPSMRNFGHAFTNIAFWNGITSLTLALPVTAYAYALNQEPEYMGNNSWEWAYDFTVKNVEYKATLTAERLNNDEFTADMSINLKALPGKGNTWFDGVISYNHTHAGWNLYKYDDGITQVKILEVEWNHNYETLVGDMTYEYVETGHAEEGSFIMLEWLSPDPVEFDAAYTISLSTGGVDVEWNRTTKAGRIADPNFFQDDQWHCWDETLVDVDCSIE